jgi:hypothetical protein
MRLVLVLILILTAFPSNGQAVFSFLDKTTFKFPDTKQGQQLKHTFKFKNTGNAPLVISSFKVKCACTKAIFTKQPIMPNQKSEITITFDTNGKYGYQDRIIYIYSNAKKSPIKLRIKVYVYNVENE